METVWQFELGTILVRLNIIKDASYQYDGDDEDGATQAALDAGELVAFDSCVEVLKNGHVIGADYLGGSVYRSGDESEFWTAHRTSAPEYRNTLEQKAARRVFCHYFPDMVRSAIADARATLNTEADA